MTIRACGRSALIIAAGFLCLAGPLSLSGAVAASQESAQTSKASAPVKLSKFTKHRSRHAHRRVTHTHKAAKASQKPDTGKTAEAVTPAPDALSPLPPAVANANAQMPEAAMLAAGAGKTLAATTVQDDPSPQAESDATPTANAAIVPSDELNDVDRALAEQKPAAPAMTMAAADAQPAAAPAPSTIGQSVTRSSEDSPWSQTSLIGKIFIAFGSLLTVASAARMFMA